MGASLGAPRHMYDTDVPEAVVLVLVAYSQRQRVWEYVEGNRSSSGGQNQ